jgi:hypothetical protein
LGVSAEIRIAQQAPKHKEIRGLRVEVSSQNEEYNGIGAKTSMTVPLGVSDRGREFVYGYDNTGRQTGLTAEPVTVASATTLEQVTGDNATHFVYDDAQNRVKMINKAGDVYYFVYDPTASVPAVVYEQGPWMLNRVQHDTVRQPDGSPPRFDTTFVPQVYSALAVFSPARLNRDPSPIPTPTTRATWYD